jgi:hypothetical protein
LHSLRNIGEKKKVYATRKSESRKIIISQTTKISISSSNQQAKHPTTISTDQQFTQHERNTKIWKFMQQEKKN